MSSKAPIPEFSIFKRIKLYQLGIKNWDIPTYTTTDELFKLYYLANSLNEKSVAVEIGSYIGASSLMIGSALKKDSLLYCIDTWENDAMTEGNWDTFSVFLKNTASVSDKIKTIKSESVKAAGEFSYLIDYLFIDGDHSYDAVKADTESWFNKLKIGGLIVMHDISWAEGVIRVVEEDVKPYLSKWGNMPNMFWGWKK